MFVFWYKAVTAVFIIVNVRTSLKFPVDTFHRHKHKGTEEEKR